MSTAVVGLILTVLTVVIGATWRVSAVLAKLVNQVEQLTSMVDKLRAEMRQELVAVEERRQRHDTQHQEKIAMLETRIAIVEHTTCAT